MKKGARGYRRVPGLAPRGSTTGGDTWPVPLHKIQISPDDDGLKWRQRRAMADGLASLHQLEPPKSPPRSPPLCFLPKGNRFGCQSYGRSFSNALLRLACKTLFTSFSFSLFGRATLDRGGRGANAYFWRQPLCEHRYRPSDSRRDRVRPTAIYLASRLVVDD